MSYSFKSYPKSSSIILFGTQALPKAKKTVNNFGEV